MQMLDKGVSHIPSTTVPDGTRFHHAGIFHLMLLDQYCLWISQTVGNEIVVKGGTTICRKS